MPYMSREEYLKKKEEIRLKYTLNYLSSRALSESERRDLIRCVEQNIRFDSNYYSLATSGNILCVAVAELLRLWHNTCRLSVVREYSEAVLEDVGQRVMQQPEYEFILDRRMKRLKNLSLEELI